MTLLPESKAGASGDVTIRVDEIAPEGAQCDRLKRLHRLAGERIFEGGFGELVGKNLWGINIGRDQLATRWVRIEARDLEQTGDYAQFIARFANQGRSFLQHVPRIAFTANDGA